MIAYSEDISLASSTFDNKPERRIEINIDHGI